MKNTFFFSYSSHDKGKVEAVKTELERLGHSVWFDQNQIGAGDPIASKIDAGLDQSEHFVVFTSFAWMQSKWTMAEFDAAFYLATNSGRQVFVVRLDSSPLRPLLASRHAVQHKNARQVAECLSDAVRPGLSALPADSWQPMPWDAVGDGYLTPLARQVVNGKPKSPLIVPLGLDTLRLDLQSALMADSIVIEDLRAELEIYATLKDLIGKFRAQLTLGDLGSVGPGMQIRVERKTAELDKSRDRIRATLQSIAPRLWSRQGE
jgi:hypothetical protein